MIVSPSSPETCEFGRNGHFVASLFGNFVDKAHDKARDKVEENAL
jgi:hypothetical protein